jgi:DNA-binding protein HU-beta
MNKQGLVEKVQEVLGGTKADAERAVDTVFDNITKSLKKGDEVSVAGFGIFVSKKRDAIKVPAMNVPKFKAAKALKEAVK